MRPSNKSRSRNKSGNGGANNQRRNVGNIINRVFESAGPDGKVRGTPQQIIDKYTALARDAQVSGDRVAAENYQQHAEHYSRLLGEAQRQQAEARQNQQERADEGQPSRSEDHAGGANGQQPRQPRPQPDMNEASGLTTIDTGPSDDPGGPIETPESSRAVGNEAGASAPAKRNGSAAAHAAGANGEARPVDPANGAGNGHATATSPAAEPDAGAAPAPEAKADAKAAENDTAENGTAEGGAEAASEEPAPKPRRGRPRRKPKDAEASEPATQAE